jgi:hypothetical protein
MTDTQNLPAISNTLLPAAQEFQMFQTIANSAKKSGLYGGDEHKIFMVLLAARELGISPMLALNGGIWNIQGKIEISARLMNSMIRRAGHTMAIESTRNECIITGMRTDTKEIHTETFTMEMAERAGLANGNAWKKFPEDMLFNRCMSRLARRLFPDVIGSAYVENEIKDQKEIERQELLQSAYEDVTPCQNENHNENQNVPIPTKSVDKPSHIENSEDNQDKKNLALNQEQIDTLRSYLPRITIKCKHNFFDFFGIKNESELYKIPVERYKGCINSFNLNIDEQVKAL